MRLIYTISIIFSFVTITSASISDKYIYAYKDIAISEMQRTRIPASIYLAQAILNSDFGQSEIAVNANNHFNQYCDANWKGKSYTKSEIDPHNDNILIESCFKVFASVKDSYIEFSNFINDPYRIMRFSFLFEYESDDYISWAKGLQQAKVSYDIGYAKELIRIIETNELYQFDEVIKKTAKKKIRPAYLGDNSENNDFDNKKTTVSYQYGIKYAKVYEGDTPRKIADRYNIHIDRLLTYNSGYNPDQLLSQGNVMYLEYKNIYYLGNKNHHTVKEGDTMFKISQIYGIQEYVLYEKNKIPENAEPLVGEKINVRRENIYHVPKYRIVANE